MSTLKSVIYFPDGGELIITREIISGPGGQLVPVGKWSMTYDGKPVDDEQVEELLAGKRAEMAGDGV